MRYQFIVDGLAAGPIRKTWRAAADDCVNYGYGVWAGKKAIAIDDCRGAEIARIRERPGE